MTIITKDLTYTIHSYVEVLVSNISLLFLGVPWTFYSWSSHYLYDYLLVQYLLDLLLWTTCLCLLIKGEPFCPLGSTRRTWILQKEHLSITYKAVGNGSFQCGSHRHQLFWRCSSFCRFSPNFHCLTTPFCFVFDIALQVSNINLNKLIQEMTHETGIMLPNYPSTLNCSPFSFLWPTRMQLNSLFRFSISIISLGKYSLTSLSKLG